jgi:hypothetical protein
MSAFGETEEYLVKCEISNFRRGVFEVFFWGITQRRFVVVYKLPTPIYQPASRNIAEEQRSSSDVFEEGNFSGS